MKKTRLLIVVGSCLLLSSNAMAFSLSFTPTSQQIMPGATESIALNLTLGAGEVLDGFDFGVAYNPTIVGVSGVTFGVNNYYAGYSDYPGLGVLALSGLWDMSGSQLTTGSHHLADIDFTGLTLGTSALTISPTDSFIYLVDPLGGTMVAGIGAQGLANVATPEPATLLLLGSGLAGLGLRRRKKNPAATV